MKVHEVEQGSLEWGLLRAGIPTASEMDALITPKFKIKTGKEPETYLNKKVAEKWQGGPLPQFQGFDMEQGTILESEAIPWFELQFDTTVNRVGFITTDDGLAGCSPDGLLSTDCGLELKCPKAETHVGYLRRAVLPDDYVIQVHASMFITGFKQWKFLSYRRGFPQLVLTIERNEEYHEVIADALDLFTQKFDEAMARMTEINGGLPRSLAPLTPLPPRPKPTVPQPRPDKGEFVLHRDEVVP